MSDIIILVVTTLLFGIVIYWLHENRNNLANALEGLFYIVIVVAVVIGGIGLLVKLAYAYPLLFILLFAFCSRTDDGDFVDYKEEEPSLFEEEVNDMKQRQRERISEEIKDLERDRDRIPTYNGFLGGSGLSEDEILSNRDRVDELDKQIKDKEWKQWNI